jgi:hypothetical protein
MRCSALGQQTAEKKKREGLAFAHVGARPGLLVRTHGYTRPAGRHTVDACTRREGVRRHMRHCDDRAKEKGWHGEVPARRLEVRAHDDVYAARWPGYRIPNGPGTIGSTKHDPKKHGSSTARGTINSA